MRPNLYIISEKSVCTDFAFADVVNEFVPVYEAAREVSSRAFTTNFAS